MRLPTGFAAWATGFALIGWVTCAGARPASAVEIAISCGAVGNALELCKQGAVAWAKKTGNSVQGSRPRTAPPSASPSINSC